LGRITLNKIKIRMEDEDLCVLETDLDEVN
jgi:hypothetical protein